MAEKIDREEAAQEVLDFMRVSKFNIIFIGDLNDDLGKETTRAGLSVLLERGTITRALKGGKEQSFVIVGADIKG